MIYIAIIIGIVLTGFILNEYYYHIVLRNTQEHQILRGKKKKNLSWISFGSSYCRYGITSGKGEAGFNFGVAAQFLYYSDKMLREYSTSCLKNKGNVYLIIADLVFAEVGRGWYGAERYNELLKKKTLGDDFSYKQRLLLRFPLLAHPRNIKRLLRYIIKGDQNQYSTLRYNELSEKEVHAQAAKRCSDWCRQFGLKDTISNDLSDELLKKFANTRKILTDMIQYCLDNDFKPILVVTPVSKIMREHLGNDFIQIVLYDNIKMSNKQNVPFMDYLEDPEFDDSSLYCNNADFLNARGRELFTKKLLNDTLAL